VRSQLATRRSAHCDTSNLAEKWALLHGVQVFAANAGNDSGITVQDLVRQQAKWAEEVGGGTLT
jgi:hypothetical protein